MPVIAFGKQATNWLKDGPLNAFWQAMCSCHAGHQPIEIKKGSESNAMTFFALRFCRRTMLRG
jgi:hypothetical protein